MASWDQIWKDAFNSAFAFNFKESGKPIFSDSEEERKATMDKAWNTGGGFQFMFGHYGDITTDEKANAWVCNFLQDKIRSVVKDQKKADLLMPNTYYATRPICDAGYYETL